MTLKEYLEKHNLSVYLFASICRVSPPVIYRVLNNSNISPKSAKTIFRVTHGVVDYKNLMKWAGSV